MPTERIDSDTVSSVRRLAAWKVAMPEGFEGFLREFDMRIDDVAIDSVRQRLYVQFKEPPQFLSCPAGICVFDLASGTFLKHIAFPFYRADDGTIQRCPTWKGTVFDFKRGRAYVTAWMDGRHGLGYLDLNSGESRILSESLHPVRWAPVSSNHILLSTQRIGEQQQVALLDAGSLTITGPYLLPGRQSAEGILGGWGDLVVTHSVEGASVKVFTVHDETLQLLKELDGVVACSLTSPHVLGVSTRPWLVAGFRGHLPRDATMSAGTVLSLPDLEPMAVLDGYALPPEKVAFSESAYWGQGPLPDFINVPGSTLLAAYVWGKQSSIVVFDAASGHRVSRFDLRQAPVDGYETIAFPFTDQQGLYIGSFGGYWIQAFGVRTNNAAS